MVEAALWAVAPVAAAVLAGAWGRDRAERTLRQRHCVRAFFAQAERLMDRHEMPAALVAQMERMAAAINDGRVARSLVLNALRGRLRWAGRRIGALDRLPATMAGEVRALCVYFLFAASYQSVIAGAVVRCLLLPGVSPARARLDPAGAETARRLVQELLGAGDRQTARA